MNEIKELLEQWREDGFTNPGSLEKSHEAILLLVAKVEELENQIKDLSS
jgi:DNA-binding transcriptional MerR regulator